MLLISLCYGRQTVITEDRAKTSAKNSDSQGNYYGPSLDNEILSTDLELPKHLTVYDLVLADSDQGWDSPLYVIITIRCIKNLRVRTQQAENRRRERLVGQPKSTVESGPRRSQGNQERAR